MDDWNPRANEIFARALEIEPEARAVLLDELCGEDKSLRAFVEELLRSHDEAGSFLERPATGIDRTVDVDPRALQAGLAATFDPRRLSVRPGWPTIGGRRSGG